MEKRKEKIVRLLSSIFYFLFSQFSRQAGAAWRWLRAVLEDDAYEQYQARFPHEAQGTKHEARQSFYLARLTHKYSRPSRCC